MVTNKPSQRFVHAMAVLGCLTLTMAATKAQISLQVVLKECEKRTIVMGLDDKGEMAIVGDRLSGYCQGILEGIFVVLVRTGTVCLRERSFSPDFLLSTVIALGRRPNPRAMMLRS